MSANVSIPSMALGVTDAMKQQVNDLLVAIESQRGLRVLFACESGSRAWGFASADSDFDVRFIFAYSADAYFRLKPAVDAFDHQAPNDIDAGGWDIRKTAELMRKSNPPLMEWLYSPIVYRAEAEILTQLRGLASLYFDPLKSSHHYLSMARNVWKGHLESETRPVRKKYLYALRPLACIRYIELHRLQPPTAFAEVLAAIDWPADAMQAIAELIRQKRFGGELGQSEPDSVLNAYIPQWMAHGEAIAPTLPINDIDNSSLDAFVSNIILKPSVSQ